MYVRWPKGLRDDFSGVARCVAGGDDVSCCQSPRACYSRPCPLCLRPPDEMRNREAKARGLGQIFVGSTTDATGRWSVLALSNPRLHAVSLVVRGLSVFLPFVPHQRDYPGPSTEQSREPLISARHLVSWSPARTNDRSSLCATVTVFMCLSRLAGDHRREGMGIVLLRS